MNILFILEYYPPHIGGVEKLFGSLTKALAKKDYNVIVITNKYDTKLQKFERNGNLKIKRLPLKNRFLFTFFGVFFMFKEGKWADIIHTTSYNAAFPAWIISKIFRKKILITFHEVWDQLWFKLPYLNMIQRYGFYLYEKLILKLPFDKYIAVSEFTFSKLLSSNIPKNSLVKIYNGIDPLNFPKRNLDIEDKSSSQKTFTYFGRLGVSKGIELIIPAFNLRSKENSNIFLKLIIPKEPKSLLKKVKQNIHQFKLDKKTEIIHELSDHKLLTELSASDFILIPSYSEGFCFAAVEASALGLPIISSNRGALKETATGRIINMENQSANALSEAMSKALENKWELIHPKKFLLEDSVNEYLRLYLSLS